MRRGAAPKDEGAFRAHLPYARGMRLGVRFLILALLPALLVPAGLGERVCLCEGLPRSVPAATWGESPAGGRCCREPARGPGSCCGSGHGAATEADSENEGAPCRCVWLPARPEALEPPRGSIASLAPVPLAPLADTALPFAVSAPPARGSLVLVPRDLPSRRGTFRVPLRI